MKDFGLEKGKEREFVQVTNGLVYSQSGEYRLIGSALSFLNVVNHRFTDHSSVVFMVLVVSSISHERATSSSSSLAGNTARSEMENMPILPLVYSKRAIHNRFVIRFDYISV